MGAEQGEEGVLPQLRLCPEAGRDSVATVATEVSD